MGQKWRSRGSSTHRLSDLSFKFGGWGQLDLRNSCPVEWTQANTIEKLNQENMLKPEVIFVIFWFVQSVQYSWNKTSNKQIVWFIFCPMANVTVIWQCPMFNGETVRNWQFYQLSCACPPRFVPPILSETAVLTVSKSAALRPRYDWRRRTKI